MALSSDSCNILGAIPGLGAIEKGIQDIFGAVAGITSAINSAISRVLGAINNIIDTAVGAVTSIIDGLLDTINGIVDMVGGFVSQVSGMIDSFINVVAAQANLSGILGCVGVIGKLTGMPAGVSADIDALSAKLASGSAVSDIVAEGIADIKNSAANAATDTLNGINDKINGTITNALGNINLGIASLKAFECQEV